MSNILNAGAASPRFVLRQRLSQRLVLMIVLASSCLTLVMTSVQLALEYRHLRQGIEVGFKRIDPMVPVITQQLWALQSDQLRLSVQGLALQSQFQTVRVSDGQGRVLAVAHGASPGHRVIERHYTLRQQTQDRSEFLGTLAVTATLDPIYLQLLDSALVILGGNLLKTLAMVAIMVMLFQRLVAQRLGRIMSSLCLMVTDTSPEARERVDLNRRYRDELDVLGHVATVAHDEIRSLVRRLRGLNDQLRAQLQEQQDHLRTVSLLEEVVLELDTRCQVVKASQDWQRVLPGVDRLVGRSLMSLLLREEDIARLLDIVRCFDGGEDGMQTLRFLYSGSLREHLWLELRVRPRHDGLGAVTGYVGVLQDVTRSQTFEITVAHMALHDALTGLPNRSLLDDRLKTALRACAKRSTRMAVLSLDIDNFKAINDALGHKAADKLLIEFSRRLQAHASGNETVARWGSDEFTVLLPQLTGTDELTTWVERLHAALRPDYVVPDDPISLTTSVGVALYPDDGQNAEDLVLAAEQAKAQAKAQGRNQIVWAEELRGRQEQRLHARIRQRLMRAVERGDIQAWVQPIVRAGSRDCDMVEVLARWHDEELGWVSPVVFIPLAEASGLIHEIGRSVWLQALDSLAGWRREGLMLRAAVNVSGRQLLRQDLVAQLLDDLHTRALPVDAVVLEITESVAMMDMTDASTRLDELAEAGFQLALDDFGTGYASLSQLHEMPLAELKIDISFVRRIDTPIGVSLIETIVKMADAMGLSTVAEGVESEAVARRLEGLGVTRLQGYAFARPMAAGDLNAWCRARLRPALPVPA